MVTELMRVNYKILICYFFILIEDFLNVFIFIADILSSENQQNNE